MAVISKWRGICANIENNNNKFWEIELHDNHDVITKWGRVAEEGKAQSKTFANAGQNFYDKKIREKMNKSKPDERYTEVRTLDAAPGTGQAKVVQSSNLIDIAKREINSNSPETLVLIERLVNANVHSITSQTTMTYNKVTGLFETPLGIVTADAIIEARDWLNKIGNFVSANDWDNANMPTAVNQYMRLIPSDFGRARKTSRDIFPDLTAVRNQNDILDSLDASLQMVLTTPADDKKQVKQPKLFETTLHLSEDGKTYDKINNLYNQTRQNMHLSAKLNIHKIYQVEIAIMDKAFREKGLPIGNIMELWHGTKISNLLSILKSGFVMPKANTPNWTGAMFGLGVYFSDQSTKSLNYTMGVAPGQRGYSSECFMFLNDVAMGKYHVPPGPTRSLPPSGYDSYFAKANQSGVRNNEMIVFNLHQINPRYLIEFK